MSQRERPEGFCSGKVSAPIQIGLFLNACECVPNTGESLWCCTEDGSRPPGAGLQEQASNRPVLLRSKGVVVSDQGKVIQKDGRYVLRR